MTVRIGTGARSAILLEARAPKLRRDAQVNRPTNDFLKSLSVSAASRLHAAQRLVEVDGRITLLNVMMAFFIIALTIFPKFIEMPFVHRNWFELLTIVLAILLMAFILLQFSAKNALRAEQFYRSGLEIQEIQRLVQFKGFNVSEREFQDLSKRFDDILQRYSLKTEAVDGFRARVDHPEFFELSEIERRWIELRIWFASAYPIFLIGLITILIMVMLVSAA